MVHVLQVFKPEAGSGTVDKSKPFDLHNMIPCKHDSPPLLEKQLALFDDHVCPVYVHLNRLPARCSCDFSIEER
jgi:hypothetical protein